MLPADSLRWASNLFRTRAVEPKPSLIKKLVARIADGDSAEQACVRRTFSVDLRVRQMLYRAGDNAVDLRIEKSKKAFMIRGQILGDGFANAAIRLAEDGRSFDTAASETSEFHFHNVPAGLYELTIQGSAVEITLKAIDIS